MVLAHCLRKWCSLLLVVGGLWVEGYSLGMSQCGYNSNAEHQFWRIEDE